MLCIKFLGIEKLHRLIFSIKIDYIAATIISINESNTILLLEGKRDISGKDVERLIVLAEWLAWKMNI